MSMSPPGQAPGTGEPGPRGEAGGLPGGSGRDGGARRDWPAPFPVDIRLVLGVHRRGSGDPAFRADPSGAVWRASLTPDGPGTLRVTAAAGPPDSGPAVTALAWGPGAGWLLESLPGLLGAADQPETFRPVHPLLRDLAVRFTGLRIGRSGRLWEALVPAVLEQKVVGLEAFRAWRLLLRRFGLPAPGRPRPACASARRRRSGPPSRPGSGTGPGWKACAPPRSAARPGWRPARGSGAAAR